MQGQKPVKNAMDLSLGRKFYVESESEVKTPQILRPDLENQEKLPPNIFFSGGSFPHFRGLDAGLERIWPQIRILREISSLGTGP